MKKKWKAEAAKKTEECDVKINAYEGEVAYLKAQHQEVGNALLERGMEFQAFVLKNKELRKTFSSLEKERLVSQRKPEQCSGGCEAAKALRQQLAESRMTMSVIDALGTRGRLPLQWEEQDRACKERCKCTLQSRPSPRGSS
ncbi:hypothetical protein GWK47_014868 [Chionoecetes opilio]|uniref:Uncharacterized protein n=1 Tax=Chionoecetes opilio TaxID=41210 RepID=A0A8J4XXV2_CHIOP|nr:hypothetical protein GWK47_014868 [Chionoecetes opilio]